MVGRVRSGTSQLHGVRWLPVDPVGEYGTLPFPSRFVCLSFEVKKTMRLCLYDYSTSTCHEDPSGIQLHCITNFEKKYKMFQQATGTLILLVYVGSIVI